MGSQLKAMQHHPRPLVPEDLLTDTERALDGFARIARAMARGDLGCLPINSLAVSGFGQIGH
jgi:hypothetical protein